MPAGFTRSGKEFIVNSYTTLNQTLSDVAALTKGGYVVTWTSGQQDGGIEGVYTQRYTSKGKAIGPETQVNVFTDYLQNDSKVIGLKGGGYVVVWSSNSPTNPIDVDPVMARVYNAKGKPVGTEFMVNTNLANTQNQPEVTALKDGGFVVTWTSLRLDFLRTDVFAQRYDGTGSKVGGEFAINTTTYSTQASPSTTTLKGGGFVVTWESFGQDGSGYGLYGRAYKANGDAKGGEFQINAFSSSDQQAAQVSALKSGGFVATWVSNNQDGSNKGIFAKVFNATGVATGPEIQVNTYTTANQDRPAVASFDDGGFVVVWQSNNQDGTPISVFGQRYSADGKPIGGEVAINKSPGSYQDTPSVTTLSDGSFVVTWTTSTPNVTDGVDIAGQHYAAQSFGTGGNNTLIGNKNGNWIDGLGGKDKISGLNGADELYGNSGKDVLLGGKGKDKLFGGAGADVLKGGAGNDRLVGGVGKDTLFGNGGADKFIFKTKGGSTPAATDQIMDFEKGIDDINLAKLIPGALSFIGNSAFTGTGPEVRVNKSAGDSIVRVDLDGDGITDMQIDVIGVTGLNAGDFIL